MNTNNEITHMTIGQLLREKREEKNLSLKVISHQTKIHLGLLELLENDQLSKLPSKIYVRGFVKSTAKVLGIEVKFALELLDQGYQDATPKPVEKVSEVYIPKESLDYFKSLKNSALTSSSLVAKFFIGFIFIAILGVNIKSYLDRPSDDSKQKLPTVLTTIHQKAKPAPKALSAKVLEARRREDEILAAKNLPAMSVNLIEDKKEKAQPVLKATAQEPVITLPKAEEKKIIDQYLPAKFQVAPPLGIQFVFLNAADGDSWVTYKVDNAEIKKFVLRQGRTLFIHGAEVRLFLGNTKTIKLFHNKNLMNFTVKSGPINLVFPSSLKTKYTEPLFIFEKDGTVITSAP
jgi:cytoskeletal protein RodZ